MQDDDPEPVDEAVPSGGAGPSGADGAGPSGMNAAEASAANSDGAEEGAAQAGLLAEHRQETISEFPCIRKED